MSLDRRELITFDNGVRLVLDPMEHLQTASVGVWANAGARDETEKQNGIAHLLEHMAFKGAAGLSALELVECVENRGGVLNASTDYERTGYYIRCLADDASAFLDIAASLALAPDLPEGELEREKGVVLQEIGEASDQAEDLVFELAQAAVWPDHALGRSVLGKSETLKPLGVRDISSFIDAHYKSSGIVISVAGAFDQQSIIDTAQKWSEKCIAGTRPERIAPKSASGSRCVSRETEQVHLVFSKPAPTSLSNARFSARVFEEILGGGMSSRLYQEVREKRGLAYTIDAYFDSYSDAGRFNIYCGCDPEDASEVEKIISDVWAELASSGPTQEEIARAKAVQKAQFAMASEGPSARASSGAYELFMFDRLVSIEEALQSIEAVSVEDVASIAQNSLIGEGVAACVGQVKSHGVAARFVERSFT